MAASPPRRTMKSARKGVPSGTALVASLALISANTIRANAIEPAGREPTPVIDVHTHVFNARDLPLRGLFSALGAPTLVAKALAKVLNAWTPDDDLDQTLAPSGFFTA